MDEIETAIAQSKIPTQKFKKLFKLYADLAIQSLSNQQTTKIIFRHMTNFFADIDKLIASFPASNKLSQIKHVIDVEMIQVADKLRKTRSLFDAEPSASAPAQSASAQSLNNGPNNEFLRQYLEDMYGINRNSTFSHIDTQSQQSQRARSRSQDVVTHGQAVPAPDPQSRRSGT